MKSYLLAIAVGLLTFTIEAQVVSIPDATFLNDLIMIGVDTNKDGKIQVSEAQTVKVLHLPGVGGILDLTGIEAFTSLENLNCYGNRIKSLDVSQNTSLKTLDCSQNQIATLNISGAVNLNFLQCSFNQLSTLDVSQNRELVTIYCYKNQITSMDLRNNFSLDTLWNYDNQLTSLDVTNNNNLDLLVCKDNPPLKQICINKAQISDTSIWVKDAKAKWNATCDVVTELDDTQIQTTSKTLERIYTPLGKAVLPENAVNGMFIYQYSDGTTRKVMK
jgi:hypothetical protein